MNRIKLLSNHLQASSKRPIRVYHTPSQTKAITFSKFGVPHEVATVQNIPLKPLGPSSVLLKMLAAPINPADVNMIQGVYPVKPALEAPFGAVGGSEGLAEVVEVGEEVRGLVKGDWIISTDFSFGTWQSYVVIDTRHQHVLKLNGLKSLSPVIGATMAVNPASAYRMLKDFVTLKPGEAIIQNGANSGVGQAVIQICKAWGIKTINVVRDRPNLQELKDHLKGLGADEVITEKDLRSPKVRNALFAKYGPIRLGLNCVGGKAGMDLGRWLTDGGVYVTYGAMSMKSIEMPASLFIFKNLKLVGFWLNGWYKSHTKADAEDMLNDLIRIPFKDPDVEKVAFEEIEHVHLKDILSFNAGTHSGEKKYHKKIVFVF